MLPEVALLESQQLTNTRCSSDGIPKVITILNTKSLSPAQLTPKMLVLLYQ
jgi:hypothetical protein